MKVLENRIPPPFVFIALAVMMWGIAGLTSEIFISGVIRWSLVVIFLLAGLFYGPPAILTFRRVKTTIDPVRIDNASQVVTTGPFSYSRNPMYVAMLMLLLAWACFLSAPWAFIGPLCFVVFINRFQIKPEEEVMAAKFGDSYLKYKSSVRRWV